MPNLEKHCGSECSLSTNFSAMLKSFEQMIAPASRHIPPEGVNVEDVAAGVRPKEHPDMALFNPKNPKVGNDICAMGCVCMHEYAHVMLYSLGFPPSERFPYMVSGLCELAVITSGIAK